MNRLSEFTEDDGPAPQFLEDAMIAELLKIASARLPCMGHPGEFLAAARRPWRRIRAWPFTYRQRCWSNPIKLRLAPGSSFTDPEILIRARSAGCRLLRWRRRPSPTVCEPRRG